MTDFHLDLNFSTTSENSFDDKIYYLGDYAYDICWGNATGEFGDYNCDSPVRLVQSAVDFIKNHSKTMENVDFIIWTGYDI